MEIGRVTKRGKKVKRVLSGISRIDTRGAQTCHVEHKRKRRYVATFLVLCIYILQPQTTVSTVGKRWVMLGTCVPIQN